MIKNEAAIHKLHKNDVLELFKISSATLSNWVRTSIPQALDDDDLYDIHTINNFIKTQSKLNSRANKKLNNSIEVPKELLNYLNDKDWVCKFVNYLNGKDKEYVASEIVKLYSDRLSDIKNECELSLIIPHGDLYSYSVAYQLILNSGDKNKNGAYYTPKFIVQEIVESLVSENKTFLEPCCGVGFFVVEYIRSYYSRFNKYPEKLIFANELDSYSAKITELNIRNLTNNQMKHFVVTCGDGLNLNYHNIDLIITNPPYGIKNKYNNLKTTEIFSHFIHRSIVNYLKPNGILNFILPYSVLSVGKHKEIRKILLEQFNIHYIKHYGKSFDGVFSDIIALEISKNYTEDNKIRMVNGEINEIYQKSLTSNNCIISNINKDDSKYFDDLFKIPHITLKDCTFALGVVTGNNAKFISNEKNDDSIEIISGKEVLVGKINYEGKKYILNKPELYQQKPNMNLFNNKKIIYKFISNKIISAVDDKKILTINSANIIILDKSLHLTEEYVSAILNSKLVNDLYSKKFGQPIKVLKNYLQQLPIFLFDKHIQNQIVENYKNGHHSINDEIIKNEVFNIIKTSN